MRCRLRSIIAADADLLVHDATFLRFQNAGSRYTPRRRKPWKSPAPPASARLVLNHLSIRYERPMAIDRLRDQVRRSGFSGPCWLLDDGEFISCRVHPQAPRLRDLI